MIRELTDEDAEDRDIVLNLEFSDPDWTTQQFSALLSTPGVSGFTNGDWFIIGLVVESALGQEFFCERHVLPEDSDEIDEVVAMLLSRFSQVHFTFGLAKSNHAKILKLVDLGFEPQSGGPMQMRLTRNRA